MSQYNVDSHLLRSQDVSDERPGRRDPNVQERRSFIKYLQSIWPELKKVRWPSRKETFNYSLVVLLTLLLMLGIILLLDSAFSKGAIFFFK